MTSSKNHLKLALTFSLALPGFSSFAAIIDNSACKVGLDKRICAEDFEKSMNQPRGSSFATSLLRIECKVKNGAIIFGGMLIGSGDVIATSSNTFSDENGNPRTNCIAKIEKKGSPTRIYRLNQSSLATGSNPRATRSGTDRKPTTWALIKLDAPVVDVRPAEIADPTKTDNKTFVVSPNLNRSPQCTTISSCDRTLTSKSPNSPTTYKMDCELVPGDEGAGVFAVDKSDGKQKLIGLASSSYQSPGTCFSTFIGIDRNFYDQLQKMTAPLADWKDKPKPAFPPEPTYPARTTK